VEPTIILYADGGAVSNPRIFFYNENDPNVVETMGFTFSQNLPALADGDYLRIVCERLNKSVTRFVSAEADPDLQFLNYLGAVDIDSTWPTLRPGNNQFSYEADSGGAYIRFAYEYELKFIGV
jgi:hypothetical protein